MELQAGVACIPGGVSRQELRHVGLRAAGLLRIETLARLEPHQVGRLEIDVGPCYRELHALVLADRAVEYRSLARIFDDLVDEPVAIADALGGDQRALGV